MTISLNILLWLLLSSWWWLCSYCVSKYEAHICVWMAKRCWGRRCFGTDVLLLVHYGDYCEFVYVFREIIQLAGKLRLGCINGKQSENSLIRLFSSANNKCRLKPDFLLPGFYRMRLQWVIFLLHHRLVKQFLLSICQILWFTSLIFPS